MTGYPDWQAYPSRVGGNLVSPLSVTLPPGTKTYGPYAINSWAGVSLLADPSAGYGTVTLRWWEDQAMTQEVQYNPWNVSSTTALLVTMPSFAPWVSLDVDVTSATDMTADLSLRGLAASGPGIRYPVTGNPFHKELVTVPVGPAVIYPFNWIRSGLAYFAFQPVDTTGKLAVSLATLNADDSENYAGPYFGNPTAFYNALIAIQDQKVGLRVFNEDASASHQFSARVWFA